MTNFVARELLIAFGLLLGVACLAARAELPAASIDPRWDTSLDPAVDLETGWRSPPAMSRTRCWWWWLNGNVTQEAITRDLEEMKAKGLGGANIIDAGGADQRGHRQVPHGPDFASAGWRALFAHALGEADRLGLELGLNIQSGWNLGGPTVRPEHAAKKLTFAETTVAGDGPVRVKLPQPTVTGDYYRDVAILAVQVSPVETNTNGFSVLAENSQAGHLPELAVDGDPSTFWVSGTREQGEGPSVERPVRLEFEFTAPTTISEIVIHPRDEYGPKRGWVQSASRPKNWHVVARWTASVAGQTVINFPPTTAKRFRLVIVEAYDPRSPVMPRNVQIAEVELRDDGDAIQGAAPKLARIKNFEQKAYYQYPGPFTAPAADHLLRDVEGAPGEHVISLGDVVDLSDQLDGDQLAWDAPAGTWKILRFGYTLSGSRVSTSSDGWKGWAIDYLDPQAFNEYWREVVAPLLEVAKPYLGRSLHYLHTDSWELGPINWTPALPDQFAQARGYDLRLYLPALAGYVVESRDVSNRFLNDFRRTLAEGIAGGKYATFRQSAHRYGLGIHPESGGPHAAPIDALLCLSQSDIPMGEFWARSPTHRVHDHERFFTKQPASAAHVYGKRVVMAEAFTSIGPQWEESPRDLKPAFDQAACEGLNLVMWHTFDCSPPAMGLPGQAYFAGTHLNPNTTWWRHADAFIGYLNRCQFLLQQGLPVADVLYFYGENVPSFVRLKAEDPAHVLPGYDYDVINADALITRTTVGNGQILLPDGMAYRVLVLPGGNAYGLAALEHVEQLLSAGATVVGPKPEGPIGLSPDSNDEIEFRELADRLWPIDADAGPATARDIPAREALARAGVVPDFLCTKNGETCRSMDYLHHRIRGGDIYFVVNRSSDWSDVECTFRKSGKQPELWDPVTSEIRDAQAFWQDAPRTTVPLQFAPNGSLFVVFRRDIAPTLRGPQSFNQPQLAAAFELDTPWLVQFDPRFGGPEQPLALEVLRSWTDSEDPQIKYYSGTAVYRTKFDCDERVAGRLDERSWLDLGDVKNIASVKLNGSPLGVVWTDPFRVETTGHLHAKGNELETEVTNLWPNRLIGDQRLLPDQRITKTNITTFHSDSQLLPSGLLGPVRLMVTARDAAE